MKLQGFKDGTNYLPYPKPGYWAVPSNGTLFIDFTADPVGADKIDVLKPLLFRSCDPGRCEGGPNFTCIQGYTGLQCSECVPNMFNFQANCKSSCEDLGNPTAVTIFGIAAVVTVWLVMNFQTQYALPCHSFVGGAGLCNLAPPPSPPPQPPARPLR